MSETCSWSSADWGAVTAYVPGHVLAESDADARRSGGQGVDIAHTPLFSPPTRNGTLKESRGIPRPASEKKAAPRVLGCRGRLSDQLTQLHHRFADLFEACHRYLLEHEPVQRRPWSISSEHGTSNSDPASWPSWSASKWRSCWPSDSKHSSPEAARKAWRPPPASPPPPSPPVPLERPSSSRSRPCSVSNQPPSSRVRPKTPKARSPEPPTFRSSSSPSSSPSPPG